MEKLAQMDGKTWKETMVQAVPGTDSRGSAAPWTSVPLPIR